MWLRMAAPEVIDTLCARHGLQKAHRLALLEQRRARQARSRKRFNFWAAVAAEIDGRKTGLKVPAADSQGDAQPPAEGNAKRGSE